MNLFNFFLEHPFIEKVLYYLFIFSVSGFLLRKEIPLYLRRLNPSFDNKKELYYLLFQQIKKFKKKKDYSPNYVLLSFFNGDLKLPGNTNLNMNPSLNFWINIYNLHYKNLIVCLKKEKIDLQDVKYFDRLTKDRFELSPDFKYDEKTFGEVIGEAKKLAFTHNKRQQAVRIGAISYEIGLIMAPSDTQEDKLSHWNNVLGLREADRFNTFPFLITDPFRPYKKILKPYAIYNNGVELYKYFKKNGVMEVCDYIKEELNVETFKDFYEKKHFK